MQIPRLHPTTLLLAYMGLALAMPAFGLNSLLLLSGLAIVLMAMTGGRDGWRMLRRARLLFLMMVLVYGFLTPGEPQFSAWGVWSPSLQGIEQGLLLAWRLGILLVILAALLSYLDRMQLLTGIYLMLSPLQAFGVPVQRIAVRLWLTLHYVDGQAMSSSMRENWQQALVLPEETKTQVSLPLSLFSRMDLIFSLFYLALMGWMLW